VPVGIGVVDATGRPYYCNQRAIQLLVRIVPTATPDQLAEVYQIYVAGTDQPYPTEKMAWALSGDRTMIDDMEIRRNNVAMPVEVWGNTSFLMKRVMWLMRSPPFRTLPSANKQRNRLQPYPRATGRGTNSSFVASEAELRALFSAIPDPLFVLTAEGRVVEAVEVKPNQLLYDLLRSRLVKHCRF